MARGARPIQITKKIVIKRVNKSHDDDEHGGAWKVAYADFMTALMAFFLLLWLLSDEPQENLQGVANYFTPTEVALTSHGGNDILDGESLQEDKILISKDANEIAEPTDQNSEGSTQHSDAGPSTNGATNPWAALSRSVDDMDSQERALHGVKEEISELLSETGPLGELHKHIQVREKIGSLVIDIVDTGQTPLFASGRSEITDSNMKILKALSGVLADVSQDIIITGHTDSAPYTSRKNYTNWELSSDRALSSRRALVEFGIPDNRFRRVSGVADTDHINKANAFAAENRRVSIEVTSVPRGSKTD